MAACSVEAVVARSLRAHGLVDPASSIGEATVAAAGIYGSSPSSHLGLAARLRGYLPETLERERLQERSILRVPGMRGSVFLSPRELVPAFLGLGRPRTVRLTLASAGMSEAELGGTHSGRRCAATAEPQRSEGFCVVGNRATIAPRAGVAQLVER